MRNQRLRIDFTHHAGCATCSVGFVCVNVHSGSELGGNTNYNIAEDVASAVGFNLNLNNLLVSKTELFSCICVEVDVSLCGDNAFFYCNFSAGTNKCTSTCTCNVAGFTNGSVYTDASCVCERDFNLCCRSFGTENGYSCELLLCALNGYSFFTSELTGL